MQKSHTYTFFRRSYCKTKNRKELPQMGFLSDAKIAHVHVLCCADTCRPTFWWRSTAGQGLYPPSVWSRKVRLPGRKYPGLQRFLSPKRWGFALPEKANCSITKVKEKIRLKKPKSHNNRLAYLVASVHWFFLRKGQLKHLFYFAFSRRMLFDLKYITATGDWPSFDLCRD